MKIKILKEDIIITSKMFDLSSEAKKIEDLPNPSIPASNGYFDNLLFYWDSFFIILGLSTNKKNKELIKGTVENFFFLLDKYRYIPNSYKRNDTRTQPPFLTTMINIVIDMKLDLNWLEKAFKYAKKEYTEVWSGKHRLTNTGLSRYYDPVHREGKEINAEDESGWDFTPRFENRCSQICPVDLNSLLYKYEKDFEFFASLLKNSKERDLWKEKAKNRKKLINDYMWDAKTGLFYDYDFVNKKKLTTKSLASYFPMWAELTTTVQDLRLVRNLKLFEHSGGLSTTDITYKMQNKQWGFPNGWAPLHYIVIAGLRKKSYDDVAKRITKKWLFLCSRRYKEMGFWDEKYRVTGDPDSIRNNYKRSDDRRYAHQNETYWTQAVFIYLYNQLKVLNEL